MWSTMGAAEAYLDHVYDVLAGAGLRPADMDVQDSDDLAEDGITTAPSAVLTWRAGHPLLNPERYPHGLLAAWSGEAGWSYAPLNADGSNKQRQALGLAVLAKPADVATALLRVALGLDADADDQELAAALEEVGGFPGLRVTRAEDDGGWRVRFVFERDDPRGWLNRAQSLGHLENMLAALGDPMELAQVKAKGPDAADQLRAVSWFTDQLTRRQDALIVALRERGTSWTDLARMVVPDEPDPRRLRSAMQRRYEAGVRRAGLPPIPGGFYRGQRVRVVSVSGPLAVRGDLVGRTGTVEAQTWDGQVTVSGLSGKAKETFADYLALAVDDIDPETPEH